MAIVNVTHTLDFDLIDNKDKKVCEDLLFNNTKNDNALFKFIEHFKEGEAPKEKQDDFEKLCTKDKISQLLIDGEKERMLTLLKTAKDEIPPQDIINKILIEAMKVVGERFGSGQMQLPFVLQSAEVMKASVDYLNAFLPKKSVASKQTTLVIGTVKGDVHDVGKNLVDIILSNNGYKVVNIGIKADIQDFIQAYKKHNADAIGMSGLLVKSTLEMKNNLLELKKQNISVPVLLGGAALTSSFVEEHCRPNYDGAVFYCKDAFDGISAMSKIEKKDFDTNLSKNQEIKKPTLILKQKTKEIKHIDFSQVELPLREHNLVPLFWGSKEFKAYQKEWVFEWINKRMLFRQRWGYKPKGKTRQEYQKILEEEVYPNFERIKREIKDIFKPIILYGYYPVKSDDNKLIIFDTNKEKQIGFFTFPRQQKKPHRALSDYFHHFQFDVMPLTLVSVGKELTDYENQLFKDGKFHEYHLVHGIGIELAEALAHIIHKQIRIELGINQKEKSNKLYEVTNKGYQGQRYSFGYDACPDLSQQELLFKLLKAKDFGISLTKNYQIVPELSTSALIVPNAKAMYYSIWFLIL